MRPIENKHIEYKQKVTPEFEKEVVAFLNSNEGGVIYIGVDKNGEPVELKDIDQEQLVFVSTPPTAYCRVASLFLVLFKNKIKDEPTRKNVCFGGGVSSKRFINKIVLCGSFDLIYATDFGL